MKAPAETDQNEQSKYVNYFDTIIMNPPFGTKNNAGIDMALLKSAALYGLKPGGTLFSLHKASTQKHIEKFIKNELPNCKGEMLQSIKFDLPNTYKFHKKQNAITEVVIVKVTKAEEDSDV